jgi:hypothetical protein
MRHWIVMGTLLAGVAAAATNPPARAAAEKPEPQAVRLDYLRGAVPGEWSAQPAGGQFRLLQFALPKAEGDPAAPLFIVFHFGKGGGGGVEENIRRWTGMVRLPEGVDPQKAVKRAEVKRDGARITTLDLAGTYLDRPFPASDQVTPRPNYRMLAAIVETTREGGDGPYFVRVVGPAKSVEAAKKGWDGFIASLKAE